MRWYGDGGLGLELGQRSTEKERLDRAELQWGCLIVIA